MNDAKYRRIRQLIIDSTLTTGQGICFDTNNAGEKGYSDDEIAIADELLANCSWFTREFLAKIRLIYGDRGYDPHIYFVEFAKIIFVMDRKNQSSMYFFEEELEKRASVKQFVDFCNSYLLSKGIMENHDETPKMCE